MKKFSSLIGLMKMLIPKMKVHTIDEDRERRFDLLHINISRIFQYDQLLDMKDTIESFLTDEDKCCYRMSSLNEHLRQKENDIMNLVRIKDGERILSQVNFEQN
jgi:hypothetical protein